MKLKIFLLSFLFKKCLAYYQITHRFLGESLADNIKTTQLDNVISNIENLIPLSQFGVQSTWADRVKRKSEYLWSAPLHYIDINECGLNNKLDLDKYCNNNCIYTVILNMTNSLRDTHFTDFKSSTEDLKFLLHFLQDLHQPLHLNGWSRGGNSWKIKLKRGDRIINTNFHTLWDSYIPEFYIKTYEPIAFSESSTIEFSGILEYQSYLKNYIEMLSNISCNITMTQQHEIDFDQYFTQHLGIIQMMFGLYMKTSMNTLLFIFN
jgi:hypothetical protein